MYGVEGLYCKRPIQCLVSSKILTPPPHLSPPGECVGGHTRWVERGWGVNILEDARHCFVLYIRKYFVMYGINTRYFSGNRDIRITLRSGLILLYKYKIQT
jgi:hypothetical protein